MFAARRGLQRLDNRGIFQPEIQKTRPGDFRFFAKLRHIEFRQHIAGKLARIHFPRFGQRHQRVALVIAEFWIGTRPDQNSRDIVASRQKPARTACCSFSSICLCGSTGMI